MQRYVGKMAGRRCWQWSNKLGGKEWNCASKWVRAGQFGARCLLRAVWRWGVCADGGCSCEGGGGNMLRWTGDLVDCLCGGRDAAWRGGNRPRKGRENESVRETDGVRRAWGIMENKRPT